MEIFTETTLTMPTDYDYPRFHKIALRTYDGELEWQMQTQCSARSNSTDYDFNLIPLGGKDCMNTVSYTLQPVNRSVTCRTLTPGHSGGFLPNKKYELRFTPRQDDELTLWIKIQLEVCHIPANSIRQLYNSSTSLADVEIQCGGLVVKAHKSILTGQSTTLQTVFASESFVEGQTAVYTISKEHMSPKILEDVIKWMYLHSITDASDKAPQLLDAAEYFQIAGLKEVCVDLLVKKLRVDNCLELLNLAYKYNIKPLKRQAIDLLVPNRKKVLAKVQNLSAACGSIPQDAWELLGLEQA